MDKKACIGLTKVERYASWFPDKKYTILNLLSWRRSQSNSRSSFVSPMSPSSARLSAHTGKSYSYGGSSSPKGTRFTLTSRWRSVRT